MLIYKVPVVSNSPVSSQLSDKIICVTHKLFRIIEHLTSSFIRKNPESEVQRGWQALAGAEEKQWPKYSLSYPTMPCWTIRPSFLNLLGLNIFTVLVGKKGRFRGALVFSLWFSRAVFCVSTIQKYIQRKPRPWGVEIGSGLHRPVLLPMFLLRLLHLRACLTSVQKHGCKNKFFLPIT